MVTRAAMMRRPLPSRTVANNPVQPTVRAAARTAPDRVAVGRASVFTAPRFADSNSTTGHPT